MLAAHTMPVTLCAVCFRSLNTRDTHNKRAAAGLHVSWERVRSCIQFHAQHLANHLELQRLMRKPSIHLHQQSPSKGFASRNLRLLCAPTASSRIAEIRDEDSDIYGVVDVRSWPLICDAQLIMMFTGLKGPGCRVRVCQGVEYRYQVGLQRVDEMLWTMP